MVERFGYLVGVAIERQRQDEALRISEQRLRKLFREAATGIAVVTEDGRFVQANEVLARMLGFDKQDLAEQNFLDRVYPEDRDAMRTAMRRLLAGASKAETLEHRFQGKTGRIVWVRARLSAQTGRDGRPSHVIAVIEDITEKREAEQKLERSRALQRVAGRIGRVGGWAASLEDDEVFWSPEIFDIVEWEGEDAPPLSETLALYPAEHRGRLEAALATLRGRRRAVRSGAGTDDLRRAPAAGPGRRRGRARRFRAHSAAHWRVPGYFRAQAARGPAPATG